MPTYKAPIDEVMFLLNDVFRIERHNNLPGFSDATPDVVEAILTEGAKLSEGVLLPLNQSGDRDGCVRNADASVTTPNGFRKAYQLYAEGGWVGISGDPAYGGQGLPQAIGAIINEFCTSANMAFTMYPGLTKSAFSALLAHGSDEQKQTYVPKLIAGEWLGTMNLTEPQCGTDLGLLRTKAVPQPDGTYAITGQKIFISAGEHDLTPNIIHLVLARIEGAPAGTKGISLFIVPKMMVNPDGSLGARNTVSCGSIERKMGIHGNATCVMNYDGATGWLVGEPNKGLNAMFVMMNEARLGVANQGLAQSEVAYQNAAAYAKERLQGRSISGRKAEDKVADPIIVHPDVRRMLLTIRAFNEAARALLMSTAIEVDLAHQGGDKALAQRAEDRLGLMTPILKGVFTDLGFDNCVLAQQVLGGHGYVAEWGMEQFVRDARIAMIYEGANGIQALDLVGRKLPKDGGRAFMSFMSEVAQTLESVKDDAELTFDVKAMKQGLDRLQQATLWFMQNAMAKPDNAGAGSTDYMHLFGLVALGHMWLLMCKAALVAKAEGRGDPARWASKLAVGRFFMERMLPETGTRLARITAGADAVMAMPAEAF
ncbi:acyl-CoA dehydrogenase C-terminal domain-containing protein [Lichenihabitans psoromatis]|uniref:acyl-CoA dehydrogenase C-terminal domain-containing protein n=1 Tax=Lichenihabitans psoromatis TaxID=2528642 RepID=UPI00103858C7|nr:acyl-CoA dehydrogenase C-terminal domain-containing protein [Lichenihabitans psoromatis]